MTDEDVQLPHGVDPAVRFFSERCQGHDYLVDGHWHTFPGRMQAFCPHDSSWAYYRVSWYELPTELPVATRYWIAGFMAGNLPEPPIELRQYENEELMGKFLQLAKQFSRTGYWPTLETVEGFYEGRIPFPSFEVPPFEADNN